MKIKICGLKEWNDCLAACEAGADMLGFNFYSPSPRYIDTHTCRDLVKHVRDEFSEIICVGIFVNESLEKIRQIMDETGLHLAQLSGNELAEDFIQLGEQCFRAVRAENMVEIESLMQQSYDRFSPPAFLLDSRQTGSYGGTGEMGDWHLAAEAARRWPILLAGGLNSGNVAESVRQVKPWGVDVASGVESSRGIKDAGLIREFIHTVRSMENTG
ncbi:MAG: phosphoribosylanthranilate isomerase [Anaerolineales bacterium]|nr:phosphoribosylanthranilate isomerase [Anaerolineales bacterium]